MKQVMKLRPTNQEDERAREAPAGGVELANLQERASTLGPVKMHVSNATGHMFQG